MHRVPRSMVTLLRMNSTRSDLMAIGSHCMYPGCNQKDFLPFKCDCCHQIYCLRHRSYTSHECTQARGKECIVVVCPLCQQSIQLSGNDDVHEAFERHCRSGACDPANYERARNRPRCPVDRCNARLTEATTYQCQECGTKVCMAHRFESDHGCKDRRAASIRGSSQFHDFVGRHAMAISQSAATAISRVAGMAIAPASNVSAVEASPKVPNAREACPHCSMRFLHVEDLVAHVANAHQGSTSSPEAGGTGYAQSAGAGFERCPHCGDTFADPVALVRHVQAHDYEKHVTARQAKSECVIS